MGGRRDQGDQIQAVLFADSVELFFFFERNIRKDQPVHSNLCCFFDKAFRSIRKYYVGIGHKHHGNFCIFTDFFYHCKNFICSDSAGQCPDIGFLDHRSLCGRV